jgi:predicted house-cleaning noncanonical NTP pyrophosphatase (MazG superfamily)
MVIFKLNKLVRDKFVDIYKATNQRPKYRTLQPEEHRQRLIDKVVEETQELYATPTEEVVQELADIQQALDDLRGMYHIPLAKLREVMRTKAQKKGTFRQGVLIEELELNDDDPWVEYYRKEPERFPEVSASK